MSVRAGVNQYTVKFCSNGGSGLGIGADEVLHAGMQQSHGGHGPQAAYIATGDQVTGPGAQRQTVPHQATDQHVEVRHRTLPGQNKLLRRRHVTQPDRGGSRRRGDGIHGGEPGGNSDYHQ